MDTLTEYFVENTLLIAPYTITPLKDLLLLTGGVDRQSPACTTLSFRLQVGRQQYKTCPKAIRLVITHQTNSKVSHKLVVH